MTTSTKDRRETRANLFSQMTAIMTAPAGEDGKLSGEQEQTYDRLAAEYDSLMAGIERDEKHAERAKQAGVVDRTGVVPPSAEVDDEEDRREFDAVFSRFLQDGLEGLDNDGKQIMRGTFREDKAIRNAAGVGTGAAGGYTVPPAFRDRIIETMKWYGPMLEEAELLETETGAALPWPTNDDTGNMGALLAENTAVSEQDVTLGTAQLGAFMYTSKLVRVSYQLLQDRPDFDVWLSRKLGERLGRILNNHWTVGTGGGTQPTGIVTGSTVGVTGTGSFAGTGGISYANLIDLVESIDPAYGNATGGVGEAPGLKFMMHQSARKALRKLLDSQNRPLWEPSLQAGFADTLLGYPTRINNDMPTLAASSKSLLFGNIRQAYVARIVRQMEALRLQERYADFLQVGFLAFERADGVVQDANAVRIFQTTATA